MKKTFFKKLIVLALNVFSITALAQCPTITNLNVTLGANGTATINPIISGTIGVFNSDYLWQVTPNATQTSYSWNQQGTFSFPANGSYTVCLTYIDSTTMCSSNQYCSVINITNYVGPPCNASFNYYTDVNCITHFNNTSTGSNISYLWNINGSNYTTTSPTVSLPNGNFNSSLKILSGGLVCDSAYSNVAINCTTGMTSCNANYSYYTDSNCVTHFINSSTGSNLTYQWNIGTYAYTSAPNPSVILPSGNHYVVFYTYSSGVKCDSIKYMISISCTSVTPACNANAAFTSYTDSSTCITYFTNQSTGTNLTYAWYDLSSPTPAFLVADTSFITILSYNINTIALYVYSNGQLCDSAINQVYLPTACSTNTVAPTSCQVNSSFYLFADSLNTGSYFAYDLSSGTGNLSYLWDFGDNTTSTQQYPFHQYAVPGQYVVCLTVTGTYTNAFGVTSTCSDTYCDSSSVQRMALGFQMSQINVIPQTVTGINQVEKEIGLHAFPNPITDELTIEVSSIENDKLNYLLMDALGQIVLTGNTESTKTTINTSALQKGFYSLRFSNVQGKTIRTIKLIK